MRYTPRIIVLLFACLLGLAAAQEKEPDPTGERDSTERTDEPDAKKGDGKSDRIEGMTGEDLESIIREIFGEEVAAEGPVIQFALEGIPLICIYDDSHDRMRIVSPIKPYEEVSDEEKDNMMESNFHGALDARYAKSGDLLYAAFIHPLSSLRKSDILSAIYQVASLHATFGEEYSSGLMTFGGEDKGPAI